MLLAGMDEAGVAPAGPGRHRRRPRGAARPRRPGPRRRRSRRPAPSRSFSAELDGLVGLAPVKAEVKLVTDLLRVEKLRTERGLPVVEPAATWSSPATRGRARPPWPASWPRSTARLEVVEKGHLVETDRAGLVAGYVGQTALKVKAVFESAMGGVLLIDEAHALARGGETDFGREAIDMIVKLMEDHRDDVVVVVAGYPDEMAVLPRRQPRPAVAVPEDDLLPRLHRRRAGVDLRRHVPQEPLRADGGGQGRGAGVPGRAARDRGFGNARLVRNLFEAVVARQASRVVARPEGDLTDDALVAIEAVDVNPSAPSAAAPPAPSPGPTP